VVSKTKSKAMLTQQCVQNAAKHSLRIPAQARYNRWPGRVGAAYAHHELG